MSYLTAVKQETIAGNMNNNKERVDVRFRQLSNLVHAWKRIQILAR